MRTKHLIAFALGVALFSCDNEPRKKKEINAQQVAAPEMVFTENDNPSVEPDRTTFALSAAELSLRDQGLVDITELDSTIRVDMKYNSTDNFSGRIIYEDISRAFLQPEVGEMLVKAQQFLKTIHPQYSLIVYDAARPLSAHQKLWDAVDAPFSEKVKFLANPANGSIHNFGAAVDVSIADEHGHPLDMGTEFDYMGELAYPDLEQEMLELGMLSELHIENRKLLRRVMRHGGFWGIQSEWWHFNACTREEARQKYPMIE
jgi:zinc D-Ala-D-Ala dipeptidase